MKTADLERSKRLKELGWKQESDYYHIFWDFHLYSLMSKEAIEIKSEGGKIGIGLDQYSAPTAGEMIEWLLGEGFSVDIGFTVIGIFSATEAHSVDVTDGICNALADACAWVMERKI